MKKIIQLSLLIFFSFSISFLNAQNNAADIDGLTGVITVPNASSLITNSSITISCWVYPRNTTPGFPDFDGIIGWRNESDCDFYLLQLNATTIEGRLRTSSNVFTVTGTGLNVNQWNHIALVYSNNSSLTVYVNGQQGQNMVANGTITNTSTDFLIGNLVFQNTNFWLDGIVDEVRVWNTARTQSQIMNFMNVELNPSAEPNLVAYYRLNDMVGSSTAMDLAGSNNGNVSPTGVTFTNSTSPVQGGIFTNVNVDICMGDSLFVGGAWQNMAGNYFDTLTAANGMDSIIITNLMIISKPTIPGISMIASDSLGCNIAGTNYDWFRDGIQLPYHTKNIKYWQGGDYQAIVYEGNCASDISPKFNFASTGIEDLKGNNIKIFPNPSKGNFYIQLEKPLQNSVIYIYDFLGKNIHQQNIKNTQTVLEINPNELKTGIYLIEIKSDSGIWKEKIVVE